MNQPLLDLYHQHVASVFDRQLRLSDYLEASGAGGGWGYDVPAAALTLGDSVRFEAPLLGSFAENNATFLWAWANKHLNLPKSNAALADSVRALAKTTGIEVFAATASIPCADLLPEELLEIASHVFGILAAGPLGFDAYYLMPYDGGCGVALVKDKRLPVVEKHPTLRISSIYLQAIDALPVYDHRAALIAYVQSYGLKAKPAPGGLEILANGEGVMTAKFDKQNRLTTLETTVKPAD